MKGGRVNMNKAELNSMQVSTIPKLLLKLQFNVTSIGFNYWITAIQQYRKNYYKYNNTIEKVYNDVAQIHNTTRTRVEKSMRTAKATATEQIQKQFNYYNKLTNKTVLELLTHNELFINDYPKVEKLEQNASYDEILTHIPRID